MILGIAAWAVMIWSISAQYASQRARAEASTARYEHNASDQVERVCGSLVGRPLRECIREQIEANRGDQRSEKDLAAQQEMADWAFWMMVVSAVTMLLTAIALWFVKGTLDATRKAVADTSVATKAMERQNELALEAQRPWIEIRAIVDRLVTTEEKIIVHYRVAFTNIGKSVATCIWTNVRVDCFGSAAPGQIVNLRESWWGQNKGPSDLALMPGETWEHEADKTFNKASLEWAKGSPRMTTIGVLANAIYRPSGGTYDDRKRTDRYFRIGLSNIDPILAYFILENDIRDASPEDIKIVKSKNTITT